jgi:hypothetical protein
VHVVSILLFQSSSVAGDIQTTPEAVAVPFHRTRRTTRRQAVSSSVEAVACTPAPTSRNARQNCPQTVLKHHNVDANDKTPDAPPVTGKKTKATIRRRRSSPNHDRPNGSCARTMRTLVGAVCEVAHAWLNDQHGLLVPCSCVSTKFILQILT